MKRFSLWFAVAVVLFSFQGGFSRPTKSQLDSLEVLIPTLDVVDTIINYDSLETYGPPAINDTLTDENYWIGVRFTPARSFTLQVVYYHVANPLISMEGCTIQVASDNNGSPGTILLTDTVGAPLADRLRSLALKDSLEFGEDEDFWILLGPVPGGPDNDNIGDGWWGVHSAHYSARSKVRYEGFPWEIYGRGDWVLRAGGEYSPPPNVVVNEVMFNPDPFSLDSDRNHEWVELFNGEGVQSTEGWALKNGNGTALSIPTITFPESTYLVVHIGFPLAIDNDFSDRRGDVYLPSAGFSFAPDEDGCGLEIPGLGFRSFISWNLKNLSLPPTPSDADTLNGALGIESFFSNRNLFRMNRLQPQGAIGPLLTASRGISVGRDSLSRDTAFNIGLEEKGVTFLGGPNAAGPTMGRKNVLPMDFDTIISDTIKRDSTWMMMLYIAADYSDSLRSPDRWCFDILNQIEKELPAAPRNVNVAVMYDTRRGKAGGGSIAQSTGATFWGTLKRDSTNQVRNLDLIMPSLNTGEASTLSHFIAWAKDSVVQGGGASTDHYVLVLKGDGAGWQGVCGDEGDGDRLDIDELKSALETGLGGDTLDLLLFDAPMMSQLEIAYQMKGKARYMVASPEMTTASDFDYARFAKKLVNDESISALDLAKFAVDSVLKGRLTPNNPNHRQEWHAIWTAVQLDGLAPLINEVNTLAQNLQIGVEDPCSTGYSLDNFQLKVRDILKASDHYGKRAGGMADFIDLKSFAQRLSGMAYPSACDPGHRAGASTINTLLQNGGSVIISRFANPAHFPIEVGGLSTYFPSSRQRRNPIGSAQKPLESTWPGSEHPYDSIGLVLEGGVFSSQYVYAADSKACYPHSIGTCDTGLTNTPARNHPFPPVPELALVDSTNWDEFLIRYYKPVADAENTFILKSVNEPFLLSGTGTSDPDSDPLTYFWDLDTLSDSEWPCDSVYREDVDKNCYDDSTDDGDIWGGQDINYGGFSTAGDHILWLTVWDDYHLFSSSPRFQTSRAKDSVVVQIEFKGVKLAYEDGTVDTVYINRLNSLEPRPSQDQIDLRQSGARTGLAPGRLTLNFQTFPHVIWSTGNVSTTTFPTACQTAMNNAMANDSQGVWICGPRVGLDSAAEFYFKTRWGFDIDTTSSTVNFVRPNPGLQHFLHDLDSFSLKPGTTLQRLLTSPCPTFPLLISNNGDTVAAARVVAEGQRAIIFSTFGLEHIADFNQGKDLLIRMLSWLVSPTAPPGLPTCPVACVKGDVNGDNDISPADVSAVLPLIFNVTTGTSRDTCAADVNCDNALSNADLGILLLMVFANGSDECGLFRSEALEAVEQKIKKEVDWVEEK